MKLSFGRGIALMAAVCATLSIASIADAKTFKWANSGDVSSMDPYARQETFLLTFTANIYDPLVRRELTNPRAGPVSGRFRVVARARGASGRKSPPIT